MSTQNLSFFLPLPARPSSRLALSCVHPKLSRTFLRACAHGTGSCTSCRAGTATLPLHLHRTPSSLWLSTAQPLLSRSPVPHRPPSRPHAHTPVQPQLVARGTHAQHGLTPASPQRQAPNIPCQPPPVNALVSTLDASFPLDRSPFLARPSSRCSRPPCGKAPANSRIGTCLVAHTSHHTGHVLAAMRPRWILSRP